MSLLNSKRAGKESASNKTVFRNTTRCLKLTEEEARLLDEVATAKGVPRSEWMRDVILRELRADACERSVARGDSWRAPASGQCASPARRRPEVSPETFDKLLDEISTTKHDLAGKLAAERRR